jgi:hypothetical protein
VPEPSAEHAGIASTLTIALADGRHLEGHAENGMLEPHELDDRFLRLTRRSLGEPSASALYELQKLEDERSLDWLSCALSSTARPGLEPRLEHGYPHTSLAVSVCGLMG